VCPKTSPRSLLDSEQRACRGDRALNRSPVDWRQLRRDEELGKQLLLDREALEHPPSDLGLVPVGDDGERAVLARYGADRHGGWEAGGAILGDSRDAPPLVTGCHVEGIEELVLDMQSGRGAPKKVLKERGRFMPKRRRDDAEVRNSQEVLLKALAVGRAVAPSAARGRPG
jgi:hypothetical protein